MKPRVHNMRANTAPEGAIYCGRGSKWGNPFRIGEHGTRAQVIDRFRVEVLPKLDVRPLRGKHLVCFCEPKPCHCDWILRKANETPFVIAATGHRPNKLGGYGEDVQRRLFTIARNYLGLSLATRTISGMALGWDQAFAEASYDLGIPFTAAVPFDGQDRMWLDDSRTHYHWLLKRAAEVRVISSGAYAPAKMQRRNVWMVNMADRVCALWDGSPGGTGNCVAHANAVGTPIDYVWWDFARPHIDGVRP